MSYFNEKNEQNESLLSYLVSDFIREKRKDRRWKNIRFFLLFLLIMGAVSLLFLQTNLPPLSAGEGKNYVSFVYLNGLIAPGESFSAETVLPLLHDAFADAEAKGVVIDINSGGGTPVQASIIHDAILNLKKQYHKKVVVVGEDMLASGAYFVAVAADKIYVNPNTLTGSIGVIMKGFGFNDLIKKLGIERRIIASGINKDRLDSFMPQNPEDIKKIRQVIGEVHSNFNQVVLLGRKGKLRANNTELFSGDFWAGSTALKLGLVDRLGNLSDALHDEFGLSRYRDYSQKNFTLKSLLSQMGTSMQNLFTHLSFKQLFL